MKGNCRTGLLVGVACVITLAVTTGCEQDRIRVYKAPKDPSTSAAAGALRGARELVEWTLPESWSELPGSGMRFATLVLEPAESGTEPLELKVTPLATSAGDPHANVIRWGQQIGLEPIGTGELPDVMREIEIAGRAGQLVNLVGPEGNSGPAQQILAAILPGDQSAWFFVIQGPAARVGKYQGAFEDFLGTVTLSVEGTGQGTAGLPAGHPSITGSAPPAAAAGGEELRWTTPSGWQEGQTEAGSFRIATFTVVDGAKAAEVAITRFPGDVGGVLANVNRWRRQVGLEPVSDLSEQPIERLAVDGQPAGLIELAAQADTPDREGMLVVLLARSDMTWFIKMTGPSALLTKQRETFKSFVESMKLTGDGNG